MTRWKERIIEFEETIPAAIDAVWDAWTTEDGARRFFAPECRIELRPGGAYEMYFDLDAGPGLRGGEGCCILAIDRPYMLSFSWNIPPEIPLLRAQNQNTHVTIRLRPGKNGDTILRLTHDGWGTGAEWESAYTYFIHAWGEVVLPRLSQLFLKK